MSEPEKQYHSTSGLLSFPLTTKISVWQRRKQIKIPFTKKLTTYKIEGMFEPIQLGNSCVLVWGV